MVNRAVAVVLFAIAALTLQLHAQRSAAVSLTVKIVSPADDSYVSGPTVLRGHKNPIQTEQGGDTLSGVRPKSG